MPQTKEELHARVERDGKYHKVDNSIIMDKMSALREQYLSLAHALVDELPAGREQSLALTKLLDESLPIAIGALARNQDQILKESFGGMEVQQ
jgi:hypothetical protein